MADSDSRERMRAHLSQGVVIPAHPLALTESRKLDERHQRALSRYYVDAGAGGIAVGVHTTQFAVRAPEHSLYRPVLELAAETVRPARGKNVSPFAMVAGVIGDTQQALNEARIAVDLDYDVALLGLGVFKQSTDAELIAHCRQVADVIPIFGFYLQPAVGGRPLSYRFWREFAEIENVWAIKIAPFNRYQTLDVVRAVIDSGRTDIALYTGNDDNIAADLLTPFPAPNGDVRRIVGGLLGQWAVWTSNAVAMLQAYRGGNGSVAYHEYLRDGVMLTDANSAIFDATNAFAGSIAGIHEILRRQGLMRGTWCLDHNERLSNGQAEEIDRVCKAYPQLSDDAFVAENLDRWLT